jgi:hypothetical protein
MPAAWNLSTMPRGVFAGMKTPNQMTLESPKPASREVGTSGRSATRAGVLTRRARTRPSRMNGSAVEIGQK